jgi:hypothetical protein
MTWYEALLLKISGYTWLGPAITAGLAAKANPTEANIQAATEALANGIVGQYEPKYLPELEAVESDVPAIETAGEAFVKAPGIETGATLADALLPVVKTLVPGIPTINITITT